MDLTQCGFGGYFSGESFSCLNGYSIKEIFSGQTKRQTGPYCAGFGSDIAKFNTWVVTSHVLAKVTEILSDKIQLNTSTNHKECTPVALRLHNNIEELLKEKLKSYGTDPFDAEKASDITTGNELLKKVVDNLIEDD